MTNYRGSATLVLSDGTEHDVHVDLDIEIEDNGLKAWGGHIETDEGTLWDAFTSSMSQTLRLPDGREAQLLVLGNDGRVTGVGPAPFGPA